MTTGYFSKFCSSIDDSEQCKLWADETERGDRTQESLYELLLNKYGEEAVAQAHVNAMNERADSEATEQQQTAAQAPTRRERAPIAQQIPIKPTPDTQPTTTVPTQTPMTTQGQVPTTKDAIIQKARELQRTKEEEERKGKEKAERKAENEQRAREGISTPKAPPPPQKGGHIPAAPSNLKDICRVCVTPPTIAILEVLKLWYTGEEAKFIEEIVDQVGSENLLLEEALAQVFIKDKNSLDGIERTLQDFNEVLAEALRIAASKSPELKAYFERERAELEGKGEASGEANEAEGNN